LNKAIAYYNANYGGGGYGGNYLTPAGQDLFNSNLFSLKQLQLLGAQPPLICSNTRSAGQECQGLPGHFASSTWLKTVDLRLSRPFQVGERVKLEPSLSVFNVFN